MVLRVCVEWLLVRGLQPAATKASRVRSMTTQNPVVLKERDGFFCIALALLSRVGV
jgi:hypothetical protein